ncbi:MAG: hypothetical protein J7545_18430 [Roseofilum sp. SBFL]|uniref:hypothetical protein n=1 Tax=unclassified Roseofilum TaxID=2620099 RepID=UPI001B0D2847|nr:MULTISPECIES: hypothetical protein [unclassified Roseofilum]MBP0014208.1 hypothetical protein [Roseofilum sp. SID3]MBP0023560.1 hypothetical protein [Roseofilum sp. SID2]MBP0043926.1 hypothetical protein [Roseofilum sp. SBFL]
MRPVNFNKPYIRATIFIFILLMTAIRCAKLSAAQHSPMIDFQPGAAAVALMLGFAMTTPLKIHPIPINRRSMYAGVGNRPMK